MKRLVESNGFRCETYESAEEFLLSFDPESAGCLVLDVRMQGMSGLELQEFLKKKGADLPILILTGHADVPVALRAMKAGAFEFLEKPVSNQILLEHIRKAVDRDAQHRNDRARISEYRTRRDSLTRRETEVMGLVVAGKANKVIGGELGLSQKTVEVHRSHLMRKMGAHSLAELVRMAVALENDDRSGGAEAAEASF